MPIGALLVLCAQLCRGTWNVVCLVCRAQFVPQMVNSLTKLGMAQGGSNLENRSLAIDLCGVMVLWEERRLRELQTNPQVCMSLHCGHHAPVMR